jgi:hypothetical protein
VSMWPVTAIVLTAGSTWGQRSPHLHRLNRSVQYCPQGPSACSSQASPSHRSLFGFTKTQCHRGGIGQRMG